MGVAGMKRFKSLESENAKPKRLLGEKGLDISALRLCENPDHLLV